MRGLEESNHHQPYLCGGFKHFLFFPHGLTGQNVTDRILGGGFNYLLFSQELGEDFQFD